MYVCLSNYLYINPYIHTYMHTYIHTYTHAHSRTRAHTHTHACNQILSTQNKLQRNTRQSAILYSCCWVFFVFVFLFFNSKAFYMHRSTDRITHIAAFVTPVVEREIAHWVNTMTNRSDDPSYRERILLPRSYISFLHACIHICM